MERKFLAVKAFNSGQNCSQAILSTFGADFGLDTDLALKLAAPFGGGMGHTGRTCGAVTGALMVIGLHCGKDAKFTPKQKAASYKLAEKFIGKFQARNKSAQCKDLLGCDISTADGMEMAKKGNLFKTVCPKMVKDASEILEDFLIKDLSRDLAKKSTN